MLRHALLTAALAGLALAGPAAAGASPPARAVLAGCQKGVDLQSRAAVFAGQMQRIAGSARMRMRFTLQARTPDSGRYGAVAAPGFGRWVTAAAGTSRYVYTKRVENLLAPASYRVTVRFRWLGARGRRIAGMRLHSASCRQPDPRANLAVEAIGVERMGDPVRRRYVVTVRNAGRSPADPSALTLSVGAEGLPSAPLPVIAAGQSALVTFEGPACPAGASLVAEADPDDALDERNEDDNGFTRPCAPD